MPPSWCVLAAVTGAAHVAEDLPEAEVDVYVEAWSPRRVPTRACARGDGALTRAVVGRSKVRLCKAHTHTHEATTEPSGL